MMRPWVPKLLGTKGMKNAWADVDGSSSGNEIDRSMKNLSTTAK